MEIQVKVKPSTKFGDIVPGQVFRKLGSDACFMATKAFHSRKGQGESQMILNAVVLSSGRLTFLRDDQKINLVEGCFVEK